MPVLYVRCGTGHNKDISDSFFRDLFLNMCKISFIEGALKRMKRMICRNRASEQPTSTKSPIKDKKKLHHKQVFQAVS